MRKEQQTFLEEINALCEAVVVGAGSPYKLGVELFTASYAAADDPGIRDIAVPVMLLWGSLTDGIDGPLGKKIGTVVEVESQMRRAATEWLPISMNESLRNQYLDRWVYEECGHKRKQMPN